jgi:preprotein translocase subunit YajC
MPNFCGSTTGTTPDASAGATGSSPWITLLIPLLLFVVIIVVMIIPQRRREKKVKDMLSGMKAGDRVRTIGGLYGKIYSIKDDIILLTVGPDKVVLEFAKSAIATVERSDVENTAKMEPIKDSGKPKKDKNM